jgi:hypothetical protein
LPFIAWAVPFPAFPEEHACAGEALKVRLESLCYVCTAAFFCGVLIYVSWPIAAAL